MNKFSIIQEINKQIASAPQHDKEWVKRIFLRTFEKKCVLGCKITNLGPTLAGKETYVFINKYQSTEEYEYTDENNITRPTLMTVNNIDVIVALKDVVYDSGEQYSEIADEEPFNDNCPLWFSSDSSRESPYHNLCVATKAVKDFVIEKEIKLAHKYCIENDTTVRTCINSMALLLTNSKVLNAKDMQNEWNMLIEDLDVDHFVLVDQLPGLNQYQLPHNDSPQGYMPEFIERIERGEVLFEWIGYFVHNIPGNDTDSSSPAPSPSLPQPAITNDEDEEDNDDDEVEDEDDDDWNIFPSINFNNLQNFNPHNNQNSNAEVFGLITDPELQLNDMIGLPDVKKKLNEFSYITRYNEMLKAKFPDTPLHNLNLHGVFMGNPGTGKTSMGRIWSAMLHKAGLLSRGHLVLANRSSFVGSKWGEEEARIKQLLKLAEGGTLLIDEAYSLVSAHESDPGRLVLPLLLSILGDESNRNISIILAGYPKEMKRLLSTNPGIVSRFSNCFEFKDFSCDQLLLITKNKVKQHGYSFTQKAWAKYKSIVENHYNNRDSKNFGNGRFVANLLELIYIKHAIRIVENDITDKGMLRITEHDIVEHIDNEVDIKRPPVGFLDNNLR